MEEAKANVAVRVAAAGAIESVVVERLGYIQLERPPGASISGEKAIGRFRSRAEPILPRPLPSRPHCPMRSRANYP